MKFLLAAAVCLALAGCAQKGGDVVSNGLTDSSTQPQKISEGCGCGGAEHSCGMESGSCSEHKADALAPGKDCGCGHPEHHKAKKGKAKKAK